MVKKISLIGAASGWGCQQHGSEFGPIVLQDGGLHRALAAAELSAEWGAMLHPTASSGVFSVDDKMAAFPLVLDMCERLCVEVAASLKQEHFPVVLGGDHSLAMGTWSGTAEALQAHGKLGLIWLDAHMDAHTLETSNQGKWGGWWHGMPLAALMGQGMAELTGIGSQQAKIAPEHVTLLGIRSYEPGEQALLEELGVRVMYMDEIHDRGFAACLAEAHTRATAGTQGYGITIDLDGFDPTDAPGVTSLEADGLKAEEVLAALQNLPQQGALKVLEIMEYNPENDQNNQTAELVCAIISSVMKGRL